MKLKRTQLSFDVPKEIRTDIKIRAAKRNVSMSTWIMRAIMRQVREEDLKKDDGH